MSTKTTNILLWVAQVLLAAMFLMAGAMKTFQPLEVIAESLPWVADTSAGLVRFIGVSELLGGIGLLLPSLLRIQPKLTVWAAMGIIAIMVLASIFHITRGEYEAIGMNVILALLAAYVAWGRSKKAPILPK